MENILNSNYYENDDIYSFDKESSIKRETITKADLFGDYGDNNSSSNQDENENENMDDHEYQDVAQEIEDNLIKDIKQEQPSTNASSSTAVLGFDENSSGSSTTNRELKHSLSFERDMVFPSMGRYSEMERDRIKRKEMKTKKELEEEEREKMQ